MNLKYTKKQCSCEARNKCFSSNFIEKQSYSERINKTDLKTLKKKDRDSIERMKNLIGKYPDFAIMITDDLKRKKSHGTIF